MDAADRQHINLDLTASFRDVQQPTPFGYYDTDPTFQADCDAMVRFVYAKLGGRVLGIEITNKEVYASFEEAMLEYSAMVNSYQAKSTLSSLLGQPTASFTANTLPKFSLEQLSYMGGAYSSEALVGGVRNLYSGSVMLQPGTQQYDLQALMLQSGQIQPNQSMRIEQIFHFTPNVGYNFYDTNSAMNYLNNEFHFNSITPEAVFYMLPVFEDVLRRQEMQLSDRVRRSNYSYQLINNNLKIFPVPLNQCPVYFTYYLAGDDPYAGQPTGVTTNLSNVPFLNLSYSDINSIGRQWVKRFAFELAKEILGQVRSKVASVPIPNGTLTLNGLELIDQARDGQTNLLDDLKTLLEALTYQALSKLEEDQAEMLQRQLDKVPMLIYVG